MTVERVTHIQRGSQSADVTSAPTTRRRLLASLGATAIGGLAGCADLWTEAEHDAPNQVSLTIANPPTDDDTAGAKIASHLVENLRAAGIDAVQEPIPEPEIYREVLINRNFDAFVLSNPGFDDLDALRPLLHSRFINERGWQNPFSFSDGTVDEALERQCAERGYDRLATFSELFEGLLETAPYTAVAFPDRTCGVRDALEVETPPRRAVDYLEILARSADDDGEDRVRVATFERELTERLNPISVDVGRLEPLLDLVYDPLARRVGDEHVPWLADRIEWFDDGEDGIEAAVHLRPETTWHDGTPLDAEDVAFTYAFLTDTSAGEVESGVPAPRYRGRSSLPSDVSAVENDVVRFRFENHARGVAERALSMPLLPEHVWEPRSEAVGDALLTDALVWENPEPIGSGLFAFEESTSGESIRLEPYENHPLFSASEETVPDRFDGRISLRPVEFLLSPNTGAAVDSLATGEVDLITTLLAPEDIETVEESDDASILTEQTHSFYLIGYNLRHPDMGNPQFRRVVSRLVDREFVASEFFHGRARAATSHNSVLGVSQEDWEFPEEADELVAFPGEDGDVDPDAVRSLFEDAGYRYDDEQLVS